MTDMILSAILLAASVDPPTIDLRCTLDPQASSMHISSTVTYQPAPQAVDKAVFFLADQMEVPKVRIVSPEPLAGEAVPVETGKRDHSVTYEIKLPKTLESGQRLQVAFEYSSKVSKGFVYLLSPLECLAGGYNTCWFPSVGNSRRMLGTLQFESPAGYIVKASGKEESATEANGKRFTSFALQQPIVPTFAAAAFRVTHVRGTVPMTVYLLKDRPIAQEYADGCSKILGVLQREYGPYPFPDFSIIETPSPISSAQLGFSGASFEGFMFADSSSVDSGFNLAYFGHEIGHQWWGNLVQLSGLKGNYMLSEAMAQYGSLQCVAALDGPVLAARYRYAGYPQYASRQCARGALMYGPTDVDRPLSAMPAGYDVVYHQLANAKGFLVWDTIARQIGRDRFRKVLHSVTSKYKWGSVTFDQFLKEIRATGGANIDQILRQWLDRKGAPVVWPEWTQQGNDLRITLRQTAPAYLLSLPVRIVFGDGSSEVREMATSSESQVATIRVSKPVANVQIDPNWEVFHSTPAIEAEAKDLKDYTLGLFASMRGQNGEAERLFTEGLTRIPSPDVYGVGFMLHNALGGVYRGLNKPEKAKEHYEAAIRCSVRNSEMLPWLYLRLALAERQLGYEQAANEAVAQAEASERSLLYPSGASPEIAKFRAQSKPGG